MPRPRSSSPQVDGASGAAGPTSAEGVETPEDRGRGGPGGGVVVLAATPIGDAEDAPPRLVRLLATADVVAAEDTRRLHALAGRLGVRVGGRVLSYHEHNESARAEELVDAARGGATVLVVSDAGTPGVSDPGYRVARAAIDAGVRLTAIPGPSAVLTALALSGLPTDRFCFEGFVPRRAGDRRRWLAGLRAERRTVVAFEAPHRLAETLADAADVLGAERAGAVARELTKTYEEVRRGTLAELAAWAADGVRGEVTLVVGGAPAEAADLPGAVEDVLARVATGARLSDAAAEVAATTGLGRRELYEASLAARRST